MTIMIYCKMYPVVAVVVIYNYKRCPEEPPSLAQFMNESRTKLHNYKIIYVPDRGAIVGTISSYPYSYQMNII